MTLCSFTTFSGEACVRPADQQTPAGAWWCGNAHERGESGDRNVRCSCGSALKYKKCCGLLPADAKHNIVRLDEEAMVMNGTGGLAKATKKTVYSAGYNLRRWVIGYERDASWRANILYLGPFYFSRRARRLLSR